VRVEEANIASQAKINALAAMEAVNPAAVPSGQMDIRPLRIRWDSQVIRDLQPPTGRLPGLAGFAVGYYNVDVSVVTDTGRELTSFRIGKVGYRRLQPAQGATR